jgi:hypothetical protein
MKLGFFPYTLYPIVSPCKCPAITPSPGSAQYDCEFTTKNTHGSCRYTSGERAKTRVNQVDVFMGVLGKSLRDAYYSSSFPPTFLFSPSLSDLSKISPASLSK